MAMCWLFVAAVSSVVGLAYCGNYTVTDEAWFNVEVRDMDGPGQHFRGRFVIALFGETAPMTTMNFASITKGYQKGQDKLQYKRTRVHRIVPDFVIQMGDITIGDGTGGKSIYGNKFNDEEFILSHRAPGYVAMANHGTDTNGSQFYILLSKSRWLDGKHVVFGKVIRGMDVVNILGDVPADPNTAAPLKKIVITDCGLNDLDGKYELKEDQLDSQEDL
jgi:peptidyl-prolyl cis-trans isomerase B (cyclophilin B)